MQDEFIAVCQPGMNESRAAAARKSTMGHVAKFQLNRDWKAKQKNSQMNENDIQDNGELEIRRFFI